ncbi:MAG: rhomboid family intramembrane serine protease [Flavobacteriaceae bacterium]|nr:rhomboid family intramembrane serine protease [Flavobacteriaceae bacterium]
MHNLHIVTLAIIAANIIVSLKGFKDFSFFEKYKFNIGGVQRGEKIRLLSSGFLHADMIHLFLNMYVLYMFSNIVISSLGVLSFLLIYGASLLAGSLLSFQFNKNNYHYSAVGASGAVMGIVYSAILLYPDMGLIVLIIPMPAWVFGILFLFYSIYGMKTKTGNIGHDAHFGGAIAGYVLTIIFAPFIMDDNLWIVVLLAIPIAVLFALKRSGKL